MSVLLCLVLNCVGVFRLLCDRGTGFSLQFSMCAHLFLRLDAFALRSVDVGEEKMNGGFPGAVLLGHQQVRDGIGLPAQSYKRTSAIYACLHQCGTAVKSGIQL